MRDDTGPCSIMLSKIGVIPSSYSLKDLRPMIPSNVSTAHIFSFVSLSSNMYTASKNVWFFTLKLATYNKIAVEIIDIWIDRRSLLRGVTDKCSKGGVHELRLIPSTFDYIRHNLTLHDDSIDIFGSKLNFQRNV